ncbi:uncharacterized protein FRV6_15414 [Fusarium oxysporum]|uniref:Uncharacterized protein n=1 Tax=Fusarium oxysporum TaxID=5507 RepID=A0A2H3U7C4_FUSOX|nr:uncharacterized protein FRV6_15414 [Fusarium oxysporum]
MTIREFFLRIIGVGETKWGMVWFMLAILLALIGNITVLISCISPSAQPIYLFRVGSSELVNATANSTGIPTSKLQIDELPSDWYWGLSGVCVIHSDTDEKVSCKQAFPPIISTEEMIAFAIEAKLGRDAESSIVEEKKSPWATALARIEGKLTEPSRVKALWQGAAAFSVISTLLSSTLLVLTVLYFTVLRDQLRRWMLYAVAFVDAMTFLGAGVMVEYAMREGPRGIMELAGTSSERGIYGAGNTAFTLGVLINFLSMELFLCLFISGVLLTVWLVCVCLSMCRDDNVVKVEYIHMSD